MLESKQEADEGSQPSSKSMKAHAALSSQLLPGYVSGDGHTRGLAVARQLLLLLWRQRCLRQLRHVPRLRRGHLAQCTSNLKLGILNVRQRVPLRPAAEGARAQNVRRP